MRENYFNFLQNKTRENVNVAKTKHTFSLITIADFLRKKFLQSFCNTIGTCTSLSSRELCPPIKKLIQLKIGINLQQQ